MVDRCYFFQMCIRRVTMFGSYAITQELNEVSYFIGSAVSLFKANSQLFLDNLCTINIILVSIIITER